MTVDPAENNCAREDNRPRVMLLVLGSRAEVLQGAERLRPVIESRAEIVLTDTSFSADLSNVQADLAIVLGGDGSILRAAQQMGHRQVPAIGVNFGKLGFLADLLPENLEEVLSQFCQRKYRLVDHLMYRCRVMRQGEVIHDELGLNEVAILAGPPFAILGVQLYVDGELATTYSCDGLIVSTPIGSTAHNLSAGGPILRKDLQAFVVCPISPHTLPNRPVVDTAARASELVVPGPHEGTTLVLDGKPLCPLTAEDRVSIQRADARFTLVEVPGHTYYRTLREKLGWGGRLKMNAEQ